MNPNTIYKQIGEALLRHVLTSIATVAISHAVITKGQADIWIPELATGLLMLLVAFSSSVWKTIKRRVGFLTGLRLHSRSTPADVRVVMDSLSAGEKWEVAKGEVEPTTNTE